MAPPLVGNAGSILRGEKPTDLLVQRCPHSGSSDSASHFYFFLPDARFGCHPAALGSAGSAAVGTALFVGFTATMAESDFSRPCIIGYGRVGRWRVADFE